MSGISNATASWLNAITSSSNWLQSVASSVRRALLIGWTVLRQNKTPHRISALLTQTHLPQPSKL